MPLERRALPAQILSLLWSHSSGRASDMTDSAERRAPILAAGGIVFREGSRPRIAIVRRRRDKSWVLPKGKLGPGERALAAAKREVVEETGHEVAVHQFLGSMAYPVNGKIKIVQFWHMRAIAGPVRELDDEIKSVKQRLRLLRRECRMQSRCRRLAWTRGDPRKPPAVYRQGLYRASRCRGVLGQPLAEGLSWQGWLEIR